jgi:hypothetical protein
MSFYHYIIFENRAVICSNFKVLSHKINMAMPSFGTNIFVSYALTYFFSAGRPHASASLSFHSNYCMLLGTAARNTYACLTRSGDSSVLSVMCIEIYAPIREQLISILIRIYY